MAECQRCLLHDDVPGVRIKDGGVCTVCQKHDAEWGDWEAVKPERQRQLEAMLRDCRGKKRKYDVLVPLSGGKDSTYVLYLCAKVYGLRCLAVTWDNGFLSDHARANIQAATDLLGVDHFYYRASWPLMKRLYRHFFLKTGMFCPVCMRGIGVATNAAAEAFDIPLVVNGTCLRTEEHVAPEFFNPGPIHFFKNALKGSPLEAEASAFTYQGSWWRIASYYFFWWTHVNRVYSHAVIALPDYVDWDYDVIYRTITSETGWKPRSSAEEEHSDCIASPVVHYLRQRKFPALVPELLRYSKLATVGVLTRDEARRKVEEAQAEVGGEPANLEEILGMLDLSRADLERTVREPLVHLQYDRQEHNRIFLALRGAKRLVKRLLGRGPRLEAA